MIRTAGTRDAAQVAFYVLLALPSALLLIVWGASTALDDPSVKEEVVDAVVDAFPLDEQGRDDVEELLDEVGAGAGAVGWIGALALLYSASGAIGALRHAVNMAVSGTPDSRPPVPGKGVDLALTLVLVPAMLVALVLNLSGPVPKALGESPLLKGMVGFLVTDLAPAALVFTFLLVLYYVLPSPRITLRAAWPGALAALVVLVLVRIVAEVYFSQTGDTGAIYGTIGAILVVALSIQLNAIAVVFGAHVAGEAYRLPSAAVYEREIEHGAENGKPLHREVLGLLRGLFVRRPPRDR